MDTSTLIQLIARHFLTTGAGALAAHGYLSSSTTEQFVSAGMLLIGVAWSWWQKEGQAAAMAELAKFRANHAAQAAAARAAGFAPPK